MKAIGGLLHRGRPGEQREFAAAFVVGVINDAIVDVLGFEPKDARAISFLRGTAVVGVSHGAIAGSVDQAATEIIERTNKKIAAAAGPAKTVTRIVTRPQPPPLP